jgi:hypothetical protein
MESTKSITQAESPSFSTHQFGNLAGYGGILSLTEAGLGGLLHAFHVPFRGAILSLNQIFLITHALCFCPQNSRLLPSSISGIGALGKSLAPCGKKLFPMLAITMQGLLYNLGTFLLGNNILGRLIGAILASLWGWMQPFLFYALIFGEGLFIAFLKCNEKLENYGLPSNLILVFLGITLLVKVGLAILIVILTPKIPFSFFQKYLGALSRFSSKKEPEKPKKISNVFFLSCMDLCKPLFIISLVLTACFFYFIDSCPNWFLWGVLRPLGVGFFSFFLIRIIPFEKLGKWVKKRFAKEM